MVQTVTINGTGPGGKVTVADLRALIADNIDGEIVVKARTSIGGWLKSVTVDVNR